MKAKELVENLPIDGFETSAEQQYQLDNFEVVIDNGDGLDAIQVIKSIRYDFDLEQIVIEVE